MVQRRAHADSRVAGRRLPWTILFFLGLLVLWNPLATAQGTGGGMNGTTEENLTQSRWERLEEERRQNPSGNHRLAAIDAFLLGQEAWDAGRADEAREHWSRSGAFDHSYLPPRLRLVQTSLLSDFSGAMVTLRQCLEIFQRDFQVQQWVLSNAILGFCLAATLASVALVIGLLLKHARSLHHTVRETLAYAFRLDPIPAGILAIVALLIPVAANLGIVVTALFYLFLTGYRYNRGERVIALATASWGIIVGPVLVVTSPWWSVPPNGRNAVLISEAQEDPTSPAFRLRVDDWIEEEGKGVALYLEGLASKVERDSDRAVLFYERAGRSGEIPQWVLQTNIGNARIQADEPDMAISHYHSAIGQDPGAFEPHYNLAVTQARAGQYLQSDARFELASRIDLDRFRALTRKNEDLGEPEPIDALWGASDLWAWTLKHPGPVVAPSPLSFFLPMRSLIWSAPIAVLALVVGLIAGRSLQRIIRVHECYQCGDPICRRCLVRMDRRAYCAGCAEALGGLSSGEATRVLLRRLLEDKREWTGQLARLFASFLPGIGGLVYGGPFVAFIAAVCGGLGTAQFLYPEWGQPLFWGPWPDPLNGLVRVAGLVLLVLAVLIGFFDVRATRKRNSTVKAFLDRDVDRLAA